MFRIAFFVLIIILSSIARAQDNSSIPCRHVDVNDFYLKLHSAENALLIDTRTYREFSKNRIPGAILAENIKELLQISDSLDFDQPLFLYCEVDQRSFVACDTLSKLGFRYVYILKGGIRDWRFSSFELDKTKLKRKRQKL